MMDRRAVEVVRVSYFKHRVHADGRLDHQHHMQVAATAGEAALGGLGVSKASPGVVNAERRFAQRRLDHQSHWKPIGAEEAILRALVNRKAGRDLM